MRDEGQDEVLTEECSKKRPLPICPMDHAPKRRTIDLVEARVAREEALNWLPQATEWHNAQCSQESEEDEGEESLSVSLSQEAQDAQEEDEGDKHVPVPSTLEIVDAKAKALLAKALVMAMMIMIIGNDDVVLDINVHGILSSRNGRIKWAALLEVSSTSKSIPNPNPNPTVTLRSYMVSRPKDSRYLKMQCRKRISCMAKSRSWDVKGCGWFLHPWQHQKVSGTGGIEPSETFIML